MEPNLYFGVKPCQCSQTKLHKKMVNFHAKSQFCSFKLFPNLSYRYGNFIVRSAFIYFFCSQFVASVLFVFNLVKFDWLVELYSLKLIGCSDTESNFNSRVSNFEIKPKAEITLLRTDQIDFNVNMIKVQI